MPACTAGALREIAAKGFTSASGGLFTAEYAEKMVIAKPELYFGKNEPAGKFMESLEKTEKQLSDNAEAVLKAGRKLVEVAKDSNKQIAEVTGKLRHGTESMGVAIDKLMKIAGRGDFEKTVKLAESFVDSLERLAVLEEKGVLNKVMIAMSGGKA